MQLGSHAAQHSEPVFHSNSYAAKAMVLRDRNIDDLVGGKKWLKDRPGPQNLALQVHVLELCGIGQQDLRTRVTCGLGNARPLEAAARIVATHIGDNDFFRARTQALANHFGNDLGIGVGGLLRSAIPANVGLYQNNIIAGDKALNPSEFPQCRLYQFAGSPPSAITTSGNLASGATVWLRLALVITASTGRWLRPLSHVPNAVTPIPMPPRRNTLTNASRRLMP